MKELILELSKIVSMERIAQGMDMTRQNLVNKLQSGSDFKISHKDKLIEFIKSLRSEKQQEIKIITNILHNTAPQTCESDGA